MCRHFRVNEREPRRSARYKHAPALGGKQGSRWRSRPSAKTHKGGEIPPSPHALSPSAPLVTLRIHQLFSRRRPLQFAHVPVAGGNDASGRARQRACGEVFSEDRPGMTNGAEGEAGPCRRPPCAGRRSIKQSSGFPSSRKEGRQKRQHAAVCEGQ